MGAGRAILTFAGPALADQTVATSSGKCVAALGAFAHSAKLPEGASRQLEKDAAHAMKSCGARAQCRFECKELLKTCKDKRWNCNKACSKAPKNQRKACKSACGKQQKAFSSDCRSAKRSCKARCKKLVQGSSCVKALKAFIKQVEKHRKGDKKLLREAKKVCRNAQSDSGAASGASSARGPGRAGVNTGKKPKSKVQRKACQNKCRKKHKLRAKRLMCFTKC